MSMLADRIEIPLRRSRRVGLLDRGLPFPDGWENGVTFFSGCAIEPVIIGECVVDAAVSEERPGDGVTFEPFIVQQSAACALMSRAGIPGLAEGRLDATTEWALGHALTTVALTANPIFAQGSDIHQGAAGDFPDEVIQALACLEQAVADVGLGADAFLHTSPKGAVWLKAAGMVSDDYMSPTGLPWIISPGYAVDGTNVFIWATGPVYVGVTDSEVLRDGNSGRIPVGWRHNTDAAYAQRLALAAFDPCLNIRASFVVPACIEGAG